MGGAEEVFSGLREDLAAGRRPEARVLGRGHGVTADLDSLPSPYAAGLLPHGPARHVCFEASRGCPFGCKYCDWQNKQKVRRFSLARAEGDMRLLLESVPEARVFVCDSDLFLDPARGTALVRAWRRAAEGRPCVWEVHTYLPRLDDEALRSLDSTQFTVCVGLQTANPRALKAVSRFFDAEAVRERTAAFRRLAPRARLNLQLIYGLPGDDPAGFESSLEFALALEPDTLMLFPALALPGSEMGRDPASFGLKVQTEPPYRVLETATFPAAALAEADRLAFAMFTLQRHPAAARVLRRAGGLDAYRRFAASLAGTPLDLGPLYERARRDLLGFVTFQEEPWAALPQGEREAGVLAALGRFAREAFAADPAAAAEAEAFLARERRDALWRETASARGFHRLFEALVGGDGAQGLWVGTEALARAEERFLPRAARWHWLPPGPKPGEPCKGASHFAPGDPLPADAGPLRRVVLSQVCGRLSPLERGALLSGLRARALPGAALAVFDADTESSLAEDIRRAGWRLALPPANIASSAGGWCVLRAEAA
ncbi:MAG: radical SAM protein [Elusimicrobia bacterium]|nr:radical SAM protein [Elusimicrobiota bacterium]